MTAELRQTVWLVVVNSLWIGICLVVWAVGQQASGQQASGQQASGQSLQGKQSDRYFQIRVVDSETGRGVPLTTNLNQVLDAMRAPLAQMLAGTLTPTEAAVLMQENAQ